MDKQKNNSYSGRFAEPQRRPSGFGTTGQPARRSRTAPKAASTRPAADKKSARLQREPYDSRDYEAREKKNRRGRGILLAVIVLAVLFAIFVSIFGGGGKTYHYMPTVERESSADFTPDSTPLPGTEVA